MRPFLSNVAYSLILIVAWMVPRPVQAAKLAIEIEGGEKVTFVGAIQALGPGRQPRQEGESQGQNRST